MIIHYRSFIQLILTLVITLIIFNQSAQAASYDATISFTNKVTLSLPVTGTINEINIRTGQSIKHGQTLLTLDQTVFTAALQEAEANLLIKKSSQLISQRDLNHAEELYEMSSLSTVSLENTQQQHKRIDGEYDIARAQLSKAKYNLDNTRLIAPFNGWVLKTHTTKHETINNLTKSTPLVTIAEAEKYTASTFISLDKLQLVKIGSQATISIGKQKITGKVTAIALEPTSNSEDNTPSYLLSISFHSSDLLRSGQTAKVNIL